VLVVPLSLAPFLTASAGGTVFIVSAGLALAVLLGMAWLRPRIPTDIGAAMGPAGASEPGIGRAEPAANRA
jgi:hypothetical protein